MARFFLLVIFLFSFEFHADETDGLPELATESEKKKITKQKIKGSYSICSKKSQEL